MKKTKRFTELDLLNMDPKQFKMLMLCLEYGTLRIAGIPYKKWWKAWREVDGSLVIEYA